MVGPLHTIVVGVPLLPLGVSASLTGVGVIKGALPLVVPNLRIG